MTLRQLLQQGSSSTTESGGAFEVPALTVEDRPRFKWRGLHLDVSRHFFNKTQVEGLLDVMSTLKLNKFHWHLTDGHGWRFEVPDFPKLTTVGAPPGPQGERRH